MSSGVARILQVIDTGGPGGAETVLLQLAAGLDRARWQCFAAVPDEGWLFRELARHGLQPIVVRNGGSFDRHYVGQLRNIIKTHRIDLLHTHLFGPAIYGSLVGALSGIPVVSTFHGAIDVATDDRFTNTKFRIIRHGADRVIFVSEPLAHSFHTRYGVDRARTSVIENAIDTMEFSPRRDVSLRRELGLRDDDILVGAVGNLRPAKRYDVFLRAAAALAEHSDKYQFVILGHWHGDIDPALLELRTQLALEKRVRFLGFHADIARVINNLDVYLLTSESEGFSLSTVQALGCGVPAVATRCGGPEAIITDRVDGFLVDVGAVGQIVAAIEHLRNDVALRERVGRAGRRTAEERFALGKQRARYATLYESVLRSSRRQPSVAREMLLSLLAKRVERPA